MVDEGARSSESIWTRRIDLPPAFARAGILLGRGVLGLFALLATALLIFSVHYWITLGPGARLDLTDAVSVRVPRDMSAIRYDDHSSRDKAIKSYLIGADDEYGGHVTVDALRPGEPLGFRDPARMAVHARNSGKTVRGPDCFRYAGFDVTATVEPTLRPSRNEGEYTLRALVDLHGQPIYISGDNVTLGVSEQAGPQTMAEAAIDLLRLTAE